MKKRDVLDRSLAQLGIRPVERPLMALLFSNMFLSGLAIGVIRVSTFTLFLQYFASEQLAIVAIMLAISGTLLTLAIERVTQTLSVRAYLYVLVGTILIGLLAVRFFLEGSPSSALIFALPLFFEIIYMLFSLQFIALLSRLLNVRQSKRLAGLARSGEFLAEIVGGLSIILLLQFMRLEDLLLVAAISVIGVMWVIHMTTKRYKDTLNKSASEQEIEDSGGNMLTVLRIPYVQLIVFCYMAFIFAYYFLDVAFYHYASIQYPEGNDLAAFIGQFFALSGFFTMLTMIFLFAPFIRKLGMLAGVIVFPLVIGIGAFTISMMEVMNVDHYLIFIVMVVTNALRIILQSAMWRPSVGILFQVLPKRQRSTGTALIEGVIDPVSGGLAGLCLYFLLEYLQWTTDLYLLLLSIVMVTWIIAGILIRETYLSKLILSISQRKLGTLNPNELDEKSLNILLEGLDSHLATDVFYCLNLLEKMDHPQMPALIDRALANQSSHIRTDVLSRIERLGLTTLIPQVRTRIDEEKESRVLGQALRTYAGLMAEDSLIILQPYLQSVETDVLKGALIGLLTFDVTNDAALSRLLLLVRSVNEEEKCDAADVIGKVGNQSLSGFLTELLEDPSHNVIDKAIIAAGESKDDRLAITLINKLSDPVLNGRAASALQRLGKFSLYDLDIALNSATVSRQIKHKIISILREIGGRKAIEILLKQLDIKEPELRHQINLSLAHSNYQAEVDDQYKFASMLNVEVEKMCWLLASMRDIRDEPALLDIHTALGHELDIHRDNIFLITSFIYSSFAIMDSRARFDSKVADLRVFAIEVLDNFLNPQLKEVIIPLLDDLTVSERLEKLEKYFPQETLTASERFDEIMTTHFDDAFIWSKSCLLYFVGFTEKQNYAETVQNALSHAEPIIRETALWSLTKINPQNLRRTLTAYADDTNLAVRKLANESLLKIPANIDA
jgi:AAA family ATP:ADP antiporter